MNRLLNCTYTHFAETEKHNASTRTGCFAFQAGVHPLVEEAADMARGSALGGYGVAIRSDSRETRRPVVGRPQFFSWIFRPCRRRIRAVGRSPSAVHDSGGAFKLGTSSRCVIAPHCGLWRFWRRVVPLSRFPLVAGGRHGYLSARLAYASSCLVPADLSRFNDSYSGDRLQRDHSAPAGARLQAFRMAAAIFGGSSFS